MLLGYSLEHWALFALLIYSVAHAIRHFRKVTFEQYLFNARETSLMFTTASAIAGNVGAGTVVGIFSFAAKGKGVAVYISLCYAVGLLLTAWAAKLIYRRNHALGANSFIDFIVLHFGKETKYVLWVTIGTIFFMSMAAQLLALGTILHATMNISLQTGLLYAYGIVTLYMLSGGYHSVTKTDLLQFLCIFITSALIYAYMDWAFIMENVRDVFVSKNYGLVFVMGIFLFLAPSAPISIDNWHRVISARDAGTARRAFVITAFFCFAIYMAFALLGIASPEGATDPITPMKQIFPEFFSFFAILALLMAVVSTMDSTILPLAAPICSTVRGDKLLAMRVTVFVLMSGILLTAYYLGGVITGLIAALSSLVALFPAVLTALLNRRPAPKALMISLPSAIITSLVLVKFREEDAFVAGIVLSFALYYGIAFFELRSRRS